MSKARRLPTRTALHLAILLLAAGPATAQQKTGSVAIIDAFKFPAKATQAHARLQASMEDAISREGWTVAQGRSATDCGATTTCLGSVARQHDAGYVLRISGQRSHEYGYEVSLDLYSLATGHVRGAVSSCDICDSKRMSEIAGKAAVDLLAKTVKEESESKETVERPAPRPAPPTVTEPPPPTEPITPPPPTEPSHLSWAPWTMIGVGALAMAYGGWALYKNGSSSGSTYPGSRTSYGHDVYSSKTLGLAGTIGGGALALVGAIWIVTTPSRTVAVSASLDHVALSLRF